LNWYKNRTQNLLLLPFAASFFYNFRHVRQIWRKRVGVEFAMIVQIASVYAALHTTRSFQSVRFSTFWSQTFYKAGFLHGSGAEASQKLYWGSS
jgi:hypothetical protein